MKQKDDQSMDALKLRLLQEAGGVRFWSSLDETRQCVLCERTFNGHAVRLSRNRAGVPVLRCPTRGCPAVASQWVHSGNPLLSEDAWRDWVRLLDTLCEETTPRAAS